MNRIETWKWILICMSYYKSRIMELKKEKSSSDVGWLWALQGENVTCILGIIAAHCSLGEIYVFVCVHTQIFLFFIIKYLFFKKRMISIACITKNVILWLKSNIYQVAWLLLNIIYFSNQKNLLNIKFYI